MRRPVKILRWLLVGAYMALIFFVSSLSDGPSTSVGGVSLDKPAHFVEFAILGVLLIRAMSPERPAAAAILALVATVAIAWAALDELHQRTVPMRSGDPLDLLADALGVLTVVLLWGPLSRRHSQIR